MSEFNWKKFQFITEVQAALMANSVNIARHDEEGRERHQYSGTVMLIHMDDAFYAAERIPEGLSAHEAACQFYGGCKGESWPRWAQRS
ncbi:hypothetical protein [Pseudomonas graminis]|uniref:hypothetical protein n=1 Tax=Pseudomonas graminis TaxID=158627 RepID=UPI0011134AD5|nr:hypothetical protein [Pseudomonas graminis]